MGLLFTDRLPAAVRGPAAAVVESRVGRFVQSLVLALAADDVGGLAAEMAYRFLFALFPFLIFLAAVLGFISSWIGADGLFDTVMGFVTQLAPSEVQQVIAVWVASMLHTESTGLLTLGALGALWGAAGGVGTLMKGLNRAYGVTENRSFWGAQLLAVLATILLTAFMVGGAILYAIGGWLERTFADAGWAVDFLTDWANGPGVAIGLLLVLAGVYTWLPNVSIPLRDGLPGAIFATCAWVLLTRAFSIYVTNFGSYDRTFGSLGAAVVMMLWMYAVGLILLVGGEINAVAAGRKLAAPSS